MTRARPTGNRRFLFAQAGLLVLLAGVLGCAPAADEAPDAQAIVDQAIERHGGDVLDHSVVTFTFRGDEYRVERDGAQFEYTRTYEDDDGHLVQEVLSNDTLYQTVDNEPVELTDDERASIQTTVNSVPYFALLPYNLQDPPVQTAYAGADTVRGEPYHRVEVTFEEEGGGDDWQDVFLYWFHQDEHTMDYLAYSFGHQPDEDFGTRFREAVNVREIRGVRFADYNNYTADNLGDTLADYSRLLEDNAVELVSEVNVEDVEVKALDASP